jgi:hypothetical protein
MIVVVVALKELKLHTLYQYMRRHHLNALFLIQVYFGSKFCPSVLEIVGLRVPARYIGDFALFSACSSCRNCPSARCASAAMLLEGTLTHQELTTFSLIVFYNTL